MTTEPRWTDETVTLATSALVTAMAVGDSNRDAATRILAALADAGLLVQPGGETRTVWEVQTTGLRWPGYATKAEALAQIAQVLSWTDPSPVQLYRRTITNWPNDETHYGPLILVPGPWTASEEDR